MYARTRKTPLTQSANSCLWARRQPGPEKGHADNLNLSGLSAPENSQPAWERQSPGSAAQAWSRNASRHRKRREGGSAIDVIRRTPTDRHILPNRLHEPDLFQKQKGKPQSRPTGSRRVASRAGSTAPPTTGRCSRITESAPRRTGVSDTFRVFFQFLPVPLDGGPHELRARPGASLCKYLLQYGLHQRLGDL